MALRMYAMYGTKYVRRVIMPLRLNEIYEIFFYLWHVWQLEYIECMALRLYIKYDTHNVRVEGTQNEEDQ